MSMSASIEASVNRVNGLTTMLTNGCHRWVADVPKTLGSNDTAPDPHDLLGSALPPARFLRMSFT